MSEPNIQFDESFFEEEERSGFVVKSAMKRAWAAELEVLFEFDRICKEYGLRYFADAGTLLGAVRHKGFVPWDDDIDLTMPREDYERFLAIAEDELPEGFVLKYRKEVATRKETFFCLVNSSAVSTRPEHLRRFHGSPYVVGIDVFPLDYLPRTEGDQKLIRSLLRIIFAIIVDKDGKCEDNLATLEGLMNMSFKRDETLRIQLLDYFVKICRMYQKDECDELVQYSLWIVDQCPAFKKEWYDETILLPFENIYIPAPKEYDKILSTRYGDYMKPVRDGAMHDYPFFKYQDIEFRKYLKANGVDVSQYEELLYPVEEGCILEEARETVECSI